MEGDGHMIFLTKFDSQFIKVPNSLREWALMFFARGGKFYEWWGPSVGGGGLGRNWSWLFTRRGDTRGDRGEYWEQCAVLHSYDADGECDHCWGWGRLTYDIGHTLIYNLGEWHKWQGNGIPTLFHTWILGDNPDIWSWPLMTDSWHSVSPVNHLVAISGPHCLLDTTHPAPSPGQAWV